MTTASLMFTLIFCPGIRGIGITYYLFVILLLTKSTLFDSFLHFKFTKSKSSVYDLLLPIALFFSLLLLYAFYSFTYISSEEVVIVLFRLIIALLPFIYICFARSMYLFSISLVLASLLAILVISLSVYLQFLGIDISFLLSADSAMRSDLVRFSSAAGNITAAAISLPSLFFVVFTFNLRYLNNNSSNLAHSSQNACLNMDYGFLSPLFYLARFPLIIYLVISPALFMLLSRHAIINFLLMSVCLLISSYKYILKFFSRLLLYLRLSKFFVTFIFIFSVLFFVLSVTINLFSNYFSFFTQFFNKLSEDDSFLSESSSRIISIDGSPNSSLDFFGYLFGQGIHFAGGSLGLTSFTNFAHNSFIDIFNIGGVLALTFFLAFLCKLIYKSFRYSDTLRYSLSLFFYFTFLVSNMFTASGILYLPSQTCGIAILSCWILIVEDIRKTRKNQLQSGQ